MRIIFRVYLSLHLSKNGPILMYAGAQYKVLAVLAFYKKKDSSNPNVICLCSPFVTNKQSAFIISRAMYSRHTNTFNTHLYLIVIHVLIISVFMVYKYSNCRPLSQNILLIMK